VALMLATRCLEWRHIPQALNASLVMTMVASLCLATALIKTGAAQSLASLLVAITPSVPVYVTLGLVMLAVTALTNFVTNNAVAVVTMPIGILMARQLGVPEEPFVLAIIFGANMPFATPYGYQTNTMIMSPGGYSEADYARIGIPLTVIMLAALTAALSTAYNLH
jgi:di/tricarboxylate transporter